MPVEDTCERNNSKHITWIFKLLVNIILAMSCVRAVGNTFNLVCIFVTVLL